jgi:hypothetical protein
MKHDWDGLPTKERLNHLNDNIQYPERGEPTRSIVTAQVHPINHAVKTRPSVLKKGLTDFEYYALAKYLYQLQAYEGFMNGVDLEASGGGQRSGGGLPCSENQLDHVRWVGFVHARVPDEFRGVLNWLANETLGIGQAPDLYDIGYQLSQSKDKRVQKGAFIGYFRAVAHAIEAIDKNYGLLRKSGVIPFAPEIGVK